MKRVSVLAAALACAVGCQTSPRHTVSGPCPLQTGQSFGPFPNAWFEQPNAPTATHYQIVFPSNPNPFPMTSGGLPLSTTLLGNVDGWSPSTQLLVWFPQSVDQTQLTPSPTATIDERIQFLTAAGAPITLVDVAAKARVPIFAEVDANANPEAGDRQALLIHPMVRLKNNARYAVAIQTSLHDLQGNPLAPEGQFAEWVDGKLTSSDPLWQISDRLDEDATVFASLGIAKSSLALAWDFDTASDANTTGQLINMVAEATAAYPSAAGITIASTTEPTVADDPNGYRVIQGTFQSPSFESGPDPSPLKFENGKPVMGALADWNISAVIPRCAEAASGPVPLLVVGHGLLGSAKLEISEDEPYFNQLCMVAIAADWVGLSTYDLGTIGNVLVNPNEFDLVTDRLQQAHVNFQILTKLALHGLASNAAFQVNGRPSFDTSRVYYFGISNGGIQGTTFLSLSSDIDRALLNVPGADWSLMMWRSNDFAAMLLALQSTYPDKLDLQLTLALTQSLWDKTDPIEFSQHLIGTSKQALFQESIGDPEVTNIATEEEMRSIGVQVLGPLVQPVYGLTVTSNTGPLTGLVYDQWTIDPTPLPPYEDVPPANNGAHTAIRAIPQLIEQEQQFLQPNGQVVNTCGGVCNYPGFVPPS